MRHVDIANTILAQLGGRHFVTMTGAKDLTALDMAACGGLGGLRLRINSTNYDRRKVNRVEVVLNGSDTYTVRALLVRKGVASVVAEVSEVYCDTLQETFERVTGMLPCFPGREIRYVTT